MKISAGRIMISHVSFNSAFCLYLTSTLTFLMFIRSWLPITCHKPCYIRSTMLSPIVSVRSSSTLRCLWVQQFYSIYLLLLVSSAASAFYSRYQTCTWWSRIDRHDEQTMSGAKKISGTMKITFNIVVYYAVMKIIVSSSSVNNDESYAVHDDVSSNNMKRCSK